MPLRFEDIALAPPWRLIVMLSLVRRRMYLYGRC